VSIKQVRVYAPASIINLGFNFFGIAAPDIYSENKTRIARMTLRDAVINITQMFIMTAANGPEGPHLIRKKRKRLIFGKLRRRLWKREHMDAASQAAVQAGSRWGRKSTRSGLR